MAKITLEPVGMTEHGEFLMNIYINRGLYASRMKMMVGDLVEFDVDTLGDQSAGQTPIESRPS
jgi:hypothetical protein